MNAYPSSPARGPGNRPAARARRAASLASTLALAAALAGCAALPSSGPTVHQLVKAERDPATAMGFAITDITPATIAAIPAEASGSLDPLAALAVQGDVDTIGPGDQLQITIFELGSPLFSGTSANAAAAPLGTDAGIAPSTGSSGSTLPSVTVTRDGYVDLPYVGRIAAAGRTPDQLQAVLVQRLRGRSPNAQVLISVRDNITNTVVVSGDVKRPGRQRLTLARARLLDAVADAGGSQYAAVDTVVRFTRQGRTREVRLPTIVPGGPDDLVLLPGDRIELVRSTRSFTAFGATPKVSQVSFDTSVLTLAEAVARIGGPTDTQADPTGVFVFRFEPPAPGTPAGTPPRPTIYRLNLLRPTSYFLAQQFAMHDKDVVYVANARANQAAKFAQIVNLLFSPIFTARAVSN